MTVLPQNHFRARFCCVYQTAKPLDALMGFLSFLQFFYYNIHFCHISGATDELVYLSLYCTRIVSNHFKQNKYEIFEATIHYPGKETYKKYFSDMEPIQLKKLPKAQILSLYL